MDTPTKEWKLFDTRLAGEVLLPARFLAQGRSLDMPPQTGISISKGSYLLPLRGELVSGSSQKKSFFPSTHHNPYVYSRAAA